MKLLTGEIIECPRCGAKQIDTVDDFVVPGNIGVTSGATDSCWDCGQKFRVTKIGAAEFEVKAL